MRDLILMRVRIALGEAKKKDIEFAEVLEYFEDLQKPNIYDPFNDYNITKRFEKDFEESVNVMEDNGGFDPKNLSEFAYFSKILYLKKKYKPNATQ